MASCVLQTLVCMGLAEGLIQGGQGGLGNRPESTLWVRAASPHCAELRVGSETARTSVWLLGASESTGVPGGADLSCGQEEGLEHTGWERPSFEAALPGSIWATGFTRELWL